MVLGRDGGLIKNMYLPFYLGVGGPIGNGNQWFPWIHVEDIAGVYCHAIENENVKGVLNGVAPQTVTNGEFAKALAGAMWRPAIIPVPSFVMNLVFGEERGKATTSGQKVIPKRTLESGYQFVYQDIKSACTQIVK